MKEKSKNERSQRQTSRKVTGNQIADILLRLQARSLNTGVNDVSAKGETFKDHTYSGFLDVESGDHRITTRKDSETDGISTEFYTEARGKVGDGKPDNSTVLSSRQSQFGGGHWPVGATNQATTIGLDGDGNAYGKRTTISTENLIGGGIGVTPERVEQLSLQGLRNQAAEIINTQRQAMNRHKPTDSGHRY